MHDLHFADDTIGGSPMYLIRGWKNIPNYRRRFPDQRCVATMGNFDGLHLGHRKILQRLRQRAEEGDMRTAVVFFEPHPREFFNPSQAPYRLMSWRDKTETIWQLGIDTAVVLHFNDRMRQMQPAQFVRRVFEPLSLGHLVVGDDSRFGVGRTGGLADLQQWGKQNGIGVEDTPTVLYNDERISSSRVRKALSDGDMALATTLLSRPWSFAGRVIKGRRLGHQLGFPTANLKLPLQRLAIAGVYAVRAYLKGGGADDPAHNGVANMGVRPTFANPHQSLEVHLLDFDGDLYGRRIRLEFVQKLRAERKFANADSLKTQIAADVERARAILQ